jgi:hypothetical protein
MLMGVIGRVGFVVAGRDIAMDLKQSFLTNGGNSRHIQTRKDI